MRASLRHLIPYLALLVGILCLSFSAMFVRWANAPGPLTAFYRIRLATVVMAPLFIRARRRAGGLPDKTLLLWPLLGGALSALDHATWNTAVLYTTAANATLLVNTAPLWVALFAWLVLREHLVGLFWVGLALALGGAAAVLGNDFLHPSVVAPTMIGQPVLTALLAIPLLNEGLHTAQLLGGLIVLAGIYLVHRSRES